MKIGILIRDAEYRDALAEKLSLYDNDLYVNIIDNSTKHTSDYLILTDIRPDEIDQKTLTAIKARTVFLIDTINDDLKGFNTVFKYGSVSNLIAESIPSLKNIYGNKSILAGDLTKAYERMEIGGENDVSVLQDMSEASGLEDVQDFVTIYSICKTTGASLITALNKAATVIM